MRLKDLTGQVFGRLTVLDRAENDKHGQARWRCRCDCGKGRIVVSRTLRDGQSQSCGCRHREIITTHGGSQGNDEYWVWAQMRSRCTNPAHAEWENYGGRGISVCDRWLDSYANFITDVGARPEGKRNGRAVFSIDRIDNDGDYKPGNVRWTTQAAQTRNSRSNHNITHGGVTLCLTDWAEKLGIPQTTLHGRIHLGWSDHEVLFGRSSQ